AVLDHMGPWSLLDVMRFLPALFSTLTIPAIYLLARRMLASEFMAGIAALAFAFLPRAFNWEIAGGGLTRAPGLLFAVLTIHQAYIFYNERTRGSAVLVPLLAALTVLCHLEMALLVAATCAIFLVAYARDRSMVIASAAMALAATVLTAPWWAVVLARHGADPLLSAAQAGNHAWYSLLGIVIFRFAEEPLFPLLGAIGLLGLFVCLLERRFLLPVWLLVLFVVDSRKAYTDAMLPLSMLIAIGVCSVILPLASHMGASLGERQEGLRRDSRGKLMGAQVLACSAILVFAFLGATLPLRDAKSPLHSLAPEQRQAMAWAAESTPTDSRFLVITGSVTPWTDNVSEWFPALSLRQNLGTVQGHEWLGGGEYREQKQFYKDLQRCAQGPVSCLPLTGNGTTLVNYVYIVKQEVWGSESDADCCTGLIEALRAAPGFATVYENEHAVIFEVTG
ncbi:MAG TPA: glycosyltransferase family 39 protein, partial [Dehalococcoidia bacterium]|nr:glycosyltransferase family 39 protein [Dehalococcoidia bacterium]